MNEHNLFYYPYAYLENSQLPLLKVAALYFDKLYILDPVGASWKTVGAQHYARDAVKILRAEGILQTVKPADVLAKYSGPISDAIRRDMKDPDFLDLCKAHGGGQWTLSLAKVPEDLQTDQAMRDLMGDLAREVAKLSEPDPPVSNDYIHYDETELGDILTQAAEFHHNSPRVPASDTYRDGGIYREGYEQDVEYRYADFPLAVGEAIMMNHALFAGLLHSNAAPVTDDPFHNQALSLKLRRAAQDPEVQRVQADRARVLKLKANLLAANTLRDSQLKLPVLSHELRLEDVLEYRLKHNDELARARDKLARMARRIEAEPWTEEFAKEIEKKTIPAIQDELGEAEKARDAWLKTKRGRLALKAGGVVVGTAAVILGVLAAPMTPIALVTAGLSFTSSGVIPGAEGLLDWRDGKKSTQQNGLHYLLSST